MYNYLRARAARLSAVGYGAGLPERLLLQRGRLLRAGRHRPAHPLRHWLYNCHCNITLRSLIHINVLGGIFGQLAGGWAGQRLYNREPRLQCVLMGLSTLSAVPLMIFLLTVQNAGKAEGGSTLFSCVAFLTGMLIFINGPNVRVVLQVVTQ